MRTALGATDYLHKPLHVDEVLAAVERFAPIDYAGMQGTAGAESMVGGALRDSPARASEAGRATNPLQATSRKDRPGLPPSPPWSSMAQLHEQQMRRRTSTPRLGLREPR